MTIADPTPAQILACPLEPNDLARTDQADAATIGGWLLAQLGQLWREGHCRLEDDGPVVKALIRAGYVEGGIDGYGDLDGYDDKRADRLVVEAISWMALTLGFAVGGAVTREPLDVWRVILVDSRGEPLDIDDFDFATDAPEIRIVRRTSVPGASLVRDMHDIAHRLNDFSDVADMRRRIAEAQAMAAGLNAAEATR